MRRKRPGTRRKKRHVRQKEQPAQRCRGRKGPGGLEDQGKKAGVAEAEQLRMKYEAEMEAGAPRLWGRVWICRAEMPGEGFRRPEEESD